MQKKNQLIFFWGLLLIVLSSNTNSQPRDKAFLPFRVPVLLEKNIIFSDSSKICFLSYKVPYSSLIFVKKGDNYFGGFVLDLEIRDSTKIIERKSATKYLNVSSYDGTKSENDYLEGIIPLTLCNENYLIKPFVSFLNSEINFPLDTVSIKQNEILIGKIGHPIVLDSTPLICNETKETTLVNYFNSIPYSLNSFDLLIPVLDLSVEKIDVKIKQGEKEKYFKIVDEFYKNDFVLEECSNRLIIKKNNVQNNVKYFIVRGFNQHLDEGVVQVFVSFENIKPSEFTIPVIWQNKPLSLSNPESAIQILEVIESLDKVDSLLSASRKDYSSVLNKYWEDKNPNKKYSFNILEYEFYKRVDYAINNFSTVTNSNGARTDRGKTYIRYGQPDNVRRAYLEGKSVTEIWEYKALKKIFSFTDKTGLGNYTLD